MAIKNPFTVALTVFITLVSADLLAVLALCNTTFIFSLDDPYIHLALAENILHGHYGVNSQEFSAPSSSILWPFLLTPFLFLNLPVLGIFLFNFLCALASLVFAGKILRQINRERETALSNQTQAALFILFVFAANLTGLLFIGMEHSLQVMLATIICWGLIERIQGGQSPRLLWLAIVAAPLVRYECLSISAAALFLLFMLGDHKKPVLAGIAISLLLLLFSQFLLSLGLVYLPESVMAKSDVASSGLTHIFQHLLSLFQPLTVYKAVPMLALLLLFIHRMFFCQRGRAYRLLAASAALALLLHISVGRIGWFFRYEIYMWVLAGGLLTYLLLTDKYEKSRWLKMCQHFTLGLCLLASMLDGLGAVILTPLASSNIYHQQYQMHRFITDYYQQPVAVNDLGWASYRNNNHVLDLWGLASHEAHQLRLNADTSLWMDAIAARHKVNLAIIYHNQVWFPQVPPNWIKLAEMDVTGPKITTWFPASFFVRDASQVQPVLQQLQAFSATLPEGTRLRIEPVSP